MLEGTCWQGCTAVSIWGGRKFEQNQFEYRTSISEHRAGSFLNFVHFWNRQKILFLNNVKRRGRGVVNPSGCGALPSTQKKLKSWANIHKRQSCKRLSCAYFNFSKRKTFLLKFSKIWLLPYTHGKAISWLIFDIFRNDFRQSFVKFKVIKSHFLKCNLANP